MDERPTHLDLFSGIGGFALAAQRAGFRTIAFCEIDPYCRKILAKNFLENTAWIQQGRKIERSERQRARPASESVFAADPEGDRWRKRRPESNGTWPSVSGVDSVPIFSNIFDFDGTVYRGCDLLTGGFPCQPFSVAGKRRGAADDRAIWPEMFRVIKESRPAWVLGENVPGIIPMEFDNVLSDLESIGYTTRPFVIPACAVDAKHRRDRLWIVGRSISDSTSESTNRHAIRTESEYTILRIQSEYDADSYQSRLEGQWIIPCRTGTQLNDTGDHCRWLPEPDVGRVAHGIPRRVDRLKGLGNAIVPQVAFEILREIRKLIP